MKANNFARGKLKTDIQMQKYVNKMNGQCLDAAKNAFTCENYELLKVSIGRMYERALRCIWQLAKKQYISLSRSEVIQSAIGENQQEQQNQVKMN